MCNILAQVALSDLLHFAQNHGGDLLRRVRLVLSLNLNLNVRLSLVVDYSEWEVLNVCLHILVIETATHQTLNIENCVGGVHWGLVLCGVADETLFISEADI